MSNSNSNPLRCVSCREEYTHSDAGTCRECYEEASETEDELKSEIQDLNSKVSFLRFWSPFDSSSSSSSKNHYHHQRPFLGFTDVSLIATDEFPTDPVPVSAHKFVLASRSPVFKAMFETEMEESRSGTINITDVSYDALRAFINYLYTAETALDEQMAYDLLVLAEKYEVKHLKMYCEKFLVSKLNWGNSVINFGFAHQYNAKHLLESALSLITDNMDKLTKTDEYALLVKKDPRLVVEIFEAYLSKQVNTASRED